MREVGFAPSLVLLMTFLTGCAGTQFFLRQLESTKGLRRGNAAQIEDASSQLRTDSILQDGHSGRYDINLNYNTPHEDK
ncbi:MAG: hypothetical protein OM95_08945 [Bdellovibrio sp. ArHS]|nr:MAG: hypothetical protein OM95_08945 [Bdellovibrio sp. ArHS]